MTDPFDALTAAAARGRAQQDAARRRAADGDHAPLNRALHLTDAARITALEELITGYRRHLATLVLLLRERQRHDRSAPPLWCVTQRAAEGSAIGAAHCHDAATVRVITQGGACPTAPAPDAQAVLAAVTSGCAVER